MKIKFTLLCLCFIMSWVPSIQAQRLLPIKKSEFTGSTKDKKMAFSKTKDAISLYDHGEGYIDQVLPLLLQAYKNNENLAKLNYNIGVCYLIGGPKTKALDFLQQAQKSKADLNEDIHFLLGLAYQYNNEFSKAIVQFKMNVELISQNKHSEKTDLIALSEKHIKECQSGKILSDRKSDARIEALPGGVNTKYDEFNPLIINGKIYFSSRRGSENDPRSNKDSKFFERCFVKDSSGGIQIFPYSVAQKSNSAVLSKSDDGNLMLYTDSEGLGDVLSIGKKKGKWKLVEKLKRVNEKNSRESSVCYTSDGKEMYFVSDRKNGFGACDIFCCKKDKDGKWQKAYNLGGEINTEFDEGDVFVSRDGQKLYFSSTGHNTIGGYDIFYCDRLEDGNWGKPHNMGMPINSTDNDITYFEDESGQFYFASERSDGLGGYDIYAQSIAEEVKVDSIPEPIAAPEPLVEKTEEIEVPEIPLATPESQISEVKMKQELVQEDFTYRVQIAACRKEMSPNDLFKRYKGGDVIEHLYVGGWHRYTIGSFDSYDKAAVVRDSCGVSDAFVVLFKGGYRLGFARKTVAVNK